MVAFLLHLKGDLKGSISCSVFPSTWLEKTFCSLHSFYEQLSLIYSQNNIFPVPKKFSRSLFYSDYISLKGLLRSRDFHQQGTLMVSRLLLEDGQWAFTLLKLLGVWGPFIVLSLVCFFVYLCQLRSWISTDGEPVLQVSF